MGWSQQESIMEVHAEHNGHWSLKYNIELAFISLTQLLWNFGSQESLLAVAYLEMSVNFKLFWVGLSNTRQLTTSWIIYIVIQDTKMSSDLISTIRLVGKSLDCT